MSQIMSTPNPASVEHSGAGALTLSGVFDRAQPFTQLHLSDGQVIHVQTALLTANFSRDADNALIDGYSSHDIRAEASDELTIPIVAESMEVGRRTVETGRVVIQKTVEEYQEALNESLAVQSYDVERVSVNRVIDAIPELRMEGDTAIYPVVEEQLVLTKQLILKEEVRVTRRESERLDTQVVKLLREHVTVSREPAS